MDYKYNIPYTPTSAMNYNGLCIPFEIWADITDQVVPGVCPWYMVSTFGNVFDKRLNRYKSLSMSNGYLYTSVKLIDGPTVVKKVHRVVKMTFDYFIGCEDLPIDHIDGHKLNNYLFNLDWVTTQENVQRAFDLGLSKIGEDRSFSILTNDDVNLICSLLEQETPYGEIANIINNRIYPRQCKNMPGIISAIRLGNTWKHISKNYNFPDYNRRVTTDEEVETVCQMLQEGYNYTDIMIYNGYDLSSMTKSEIYKIKDIYRGIKYRRIHTSISSKYTFPTDESKV